MINGSQQSDDRGQTLWHEGDQNGYGKGDGGGPIAFIRSGDTNDEEDDGEEDSDGRDKRHEARTATGQSCKHSK